MNLLVYEVSKTVVRVSVGFVALVAGSACESVQLVVGVVQVVPVHAVQAAAVTAGAAPVLCKYVTVGVSQQLQVIDTISKQ